MLDLLFVDRWSRAGVTARGWIPRGVLRPLTWPATWLRYCSLGCCGCDDPHAAILRSLSDLRSTTPWMCVGHWTQRSRSLSYACARHSLSLALLVPLRTRLSPRHTDFNSSSSPFHQAMISLPTFHIKGFKP